MADSAPGPGTDLQSTVDLLAAVRTGSSEARDRLIRRYLPALRSWAHGRLPQNARILNETDDLVQVALLRALDRVQEFEPRRPGAFMAYLRRILMNQIRDEIRRCGRTPPTEELGDNVEVAAPSPLEQVIGRQTLERYEKALAELTPEQQEAVVLRVELSFTHREVAEALGSPSPNAARMLVARALVRLAEVMHEQVD